MLQNEFDTDDYSYIKNIYSTKGTTNLMEKISKANPGTKTREDKLHIRSKLEALQRIDDMLYLHKDPMSTEILLILRKWVRKS